MMVGGLLQFKKYDQTQRGRTSQDEQDQLDLLQDTFNNLCFDYSAELSQAG